MTTTFNNDESNWDWEFEFYSDNEDKAIWVRSRCVAVIVQQWLLCFSEKTWQYSELRNHFSLRRKWQLNTESLSALFDFQ